MSKHLQRELDNLKRDLLLIGSKVKEAVESSVVAFNESRPELAEAVIKNDEEIDRKEVEVEEECLKLLALHQPVAEDLRFIAAVLKINNDLERIGDGAVSIAKRALHLNKSEPFELPKDIKIMAELTCKMVSESLKAFVDGDTKAAHAICAEDDRVDVFHKKMIKELRVMMADNPDLIDPALDVFSTVRRLERISDLATNIAEEVVYMVEGEIIRHQVRI